MNAFSMNNHNFSKTAPFTVRNKGIKSYARFILVQPVQIKICLRPHIQNIFSVLLLCAFNSLFCNFIFIYSSIAVEPIFHRVNL